MTSSTSDTCQLGPQKIVYYVMIPSDADLSKPAPVIGWSALSYNDGSPVPTCEPPARAQCVAVEKMTAERWDQIRFDENGLGGSKAYFNGEIVEYTPPPYIPPLKEQAQTAMQDVQRQAAMVAAISDTFGPQMREYVKALRAIISGSDTTSTELPIAPDDATT